MKCLCCNKEIKGTDVNGWHKACIKRFFGTSELPEIELTDEKLRSLADETINKGLTVAGVQKKLSLHLTTGSNPRLTIVDYPTGYILKPQADNFRCLPESEFIVMQMAHAAGISTVPCALLKAGEGYAYITSRIDRIAAGKEYPTGVMLAMEDFCQLDGRMTQDKYRGSCERCAKIIQKYSSRAGLDMTELFVRLVFCYITGNSDMHLKNFSLIEDKPESGQYILAPAYDLLPVNVIMPEDTEAFAIPINGKKNNLHRNDFLNFAEGTGIERKTASKLIDRLISQKMLFKQMNDESLLDMDLKERFSKLIETRCEMLRVGTQE